MVVSALKNKKNGVIKLLYTLPTLNHKHLQCIISAIKDDVFQLLFVFFGSSAFGTA
jgi:hypothetical protein